MSNITELAELESEFCFLRQPVKEYLKQIYEIQYNAFLWKVQWLFV